MIHALYHLLVMWPAWAVMTLPDALQASPTDPFDLVGFISSAGVLGVLVWFMWAFLIKNPPLFVTWREHKASLDIIDELNDQLNSLVGVAKKTAEQQQPDKRTPSSYRVAARKRQDGEP